MRTFTFLIVASLTFPALAQKKPADSGSELVSQLSAAIPDLMDRGMVPGLSVALIQNSRIVWSRGFGVRNAATKEPVDEHTVFEAASLTKPVVAYAALKLADQGKLDLDAPLSRYLPAPYIDGDPRLDQVTARRVLSHNSGFPNWRPDGKPLVIHFTPGERFSYSGEGFVYLGQVMERITGVLLDRFVAQTVFEPLGMKESSLVWEKQFDLQTATGHTEAGIPIPKRKPLKHNAAASMHTTATDYARFMIAVINGTGLKPATARAMVGTQMKVDKGCSNCIGRPVTQPSDTISWGLGVGLQHTTAGDSFWHWGDNGAFRCMMVAYPASKQGMIIFTNSGNGLSIAPHIAKLAMREPQPAFAWVNYASYDSLPFTLFQTIRKEGIDAGIALYRNARTTITERDMNTLGYRLLGAKKIQEAIAIFKLNVEAHPKSANVYDSLGEAYMTNGDKELAIKNYEMSVQLNPANTDGIEALKKLRAKP